MNPAAASIAAHRFGLGDPDLSRIGSDAAGWLRAQIGPAGPQRGSDLASSADGLRAHVAFQRARRDRRSMAEQAMASTEQAFGDHFKTIAQADVRARIATAVLAERPFAERLALFWANHFTVAMVKAPVRGLAGAFEREAIRPHVAGSFEILLKAAVKHAAMLRYLDNEQSAGPDSRVVKLMARRARGDDETPRITGLNENLAREVMELHTLGVNGGYSQADVTAFAAVLTGWRAPLRGLSADSDEDPVRFDPNWHQPGAKTVLGKRYREGPQALDEVLHDLARHPSTARFVATKLARHFVADDPPATLVARLEQAFRAGDGDLPTVYRALIDAPEAWVAAPTKLKTPEEFVISTLRVLKLGDQPLARQPDAGISLLGQRVLAAPSPAGWPDKAEEWLGPDAVWKRVEWATRVADRTGRFVDARALARTSLGPRLTETSATQIERAADGAQALALFLLSPEFQRR